MKYELERLGPDNFEHLVQSLLRGSTGNAITIYGAGPDGQREAVIRRREHEPGGHTEKCCRAVVQAKFKSADTKENDWTWLRRNLKNELDGFVQKASTYPDTVP